MQLPSEISCLGDLVDKLREARLYITNLNRVSGVIARRLAIISFRLNPSMATWTVVSRSSFGEDSSYRGRHSRLSTKNILKTLNACPSSLSWYRIIRRIDRSMRERLYECTFFRIVSCILKFNFKCFWLATFGPSNEPRSMTFAFGIPIFTLLSSRSLRRNYKYFLH